MGSNNNILVFGDGESVLIQKRVEILNGLHQNNIFIHSATGKKLTEHAKSYFHGFQIIEQPLINNRTLRYIVSCFLTLFYILKFRPKLIVVHWASRLYQNIILRLFAKRIIVTVMGGEILPYFEGKHPQKRFYTKMLLDNARSITTESLYMKKLMIDDFEIKEERIVVCNFGVEESFYKPIIDEGLYAKLGIQRGVKVFFSMRAMEPHYQIHTIVEGFIRFKHKTDSDAVLIVTATRSSPEYLMKIENMVRQSGVAESVIIVKDILHEEVSKYIALSDAVISMVASDGLPHTMLECLASKKFMIFRDLPQYEGFLIHGYNSFLVDLDEMLVEAFEYVVTTANLEYEANNEVLALMDKKKLTQKYLSVCNQIILENR